MLYFEQEKGIGYRNAAAHLLEAWENNPVRFAYDVFGIDLWDRQREMILSAVNSHHFAWKSGHKTGKSLDAALIAYWWACTRKGGRVGLTSSSYLQVKKILWREIKALYRMAKVDLGGKIHDDPRSGLVWETGNEIFGFTTKDKERAAGYSGPNNLFIVDEASGRGLEDIYDALEGNVAGGGKIGMFSNPTRNSGIFFEAFASKTSIWTTGSISSRETPNVKEGRIVVPGLATKEWVELREKEWGKDHPLFLIRVEGKFPKYSDTSIIPYDLLEESQINWRAHRLQYDGKEKGDWQMIATQPGDFRVGIDVARHGSDDSVLQPLRGLIALQPKNYHGLDGPELAAEFLDYIDMARESGALPIEEVKVIALVDEIGEGSSCFDALRHSHRAKILRVQLVSIKASRGPNYPEKFKDLYTEMLFNIRYWLLLGGMLPENVKLDKELLFAEYLLDEKARYCRRFTKEEEKKEANIGHSPDNRDALADAVPGGLIPPDFAGMKSVPHDSLGSYVSSEGDLHLPERRIVHPNSSHLTDVTTERDWIRSFLK